MGPPDFRAVGFNLAHLPLLHYRVGMGKLSICRDSDSVRVPIWETWAGFRLAGGTRSSHEAVLTTFGIET